MSGDREPLTEYEIQTRNEMIKDMKLGSPNFKIEFDYLIIKIIKKKEPKEDLPNDDGTRSRRQNKNQQRRRFRFDNQVAANFSLAKKIIELI